MQEMKPLVRVIDDDDAMRRSWAFLIEGEGWNVITYSDALDFLSSNEFHRPGCIVLDVRIMRLLLLNINYLRHHSLSKPCRKILWILNTLA